MVCGRGRNWKAHGDWLDGRGGVGRGQARFRRRCRTMRQQKTAGPTTCRFAICDFVADYFLLTDFLSSAPGVNFATLRAAILIVAPVCGLRPFRAFLCDTENVPKPINATRSPLRRAEVMLSTAVSIAVVACALLISQAPAILSTRSALFIVSPRRSRSCPAYTGRKMALAELGNLTVLYSPPSAANVNCENPRRKPVSH